MKDEEKSLCEGRLPSFRTRKTFPVQGEINVIKDGENSLEGTGDRHQGRRKFPVHREIENSMPRPRTRQRFRYSWPIWWEKSHILLGMVTTSVSRVVLPVGKFLSALGWVERRRLTRGSTRRDATRDYNRSDELAKREWLTGRLRAVAPWCIYGSDR